MMEGVQCNCEIAARLDLSLSLVSHHAHNLRQLGLVEGERAVEDARWIYYSVKQGAVTELSEAMGRLQDTKLIQPRTLGCGPGQCRTC